jgi:hypothetical protein
MNLPTNPESKGKAREAVTTKDRAWPVKMTTTINPRWQKQNKKNAVLLIVYRTAVRFVLWP